jgi:ferrous iron transport protein B
MLLVGSPNSGKSAVFGALTGTYATVSNYPGTTVDVTTAFCSIDGTAYEVIDTPGMYSLVPITEEERVARSILFSTHPDVVVHVIDAKNIDRALHLTIQLREAGFPLLVDLNIFDEVNEHGLIFDISKLSAELGVPVVTSIATKNAGIEQLKSSIRSLKSSQAMFLEYGEAIEKNIRQIEETLQIEENFPSRFRAMMILGDDSNLVREEGGKFIFEEMIVKQTDERIVDVHLDYRFAVTRQEWIDKVLEKSMKYDERIRKPWKDQLGNLMIDNVWGIPFLLAIVFVFYEFVGVFGAKYLVDFLENDVFGRYIIPPITLFLESIIPWKVVQDLFVHEYGIITLGVKYAIAIIFPIVTTFFLFFSVCEDSGYLPRLSMLIDGTFKKIGLSGRAVIPLVLGLGCGTMAMMVTRTLETRRERILASFLLALAIPCSAQIGVILALLYGNVWFLITFLIVTAGIFLLVGFLSTSLMPGEPPIFYMEIPPLRLPTLRNVFLKTYTRLVWYFKEILPLFVIASILIWLGNITGVLSILVDVVSYPVRWIGLPTEAAPAFLYGFFRRDFGAAGLYELKQSGVLTGIPTLVASITITLFIPCIAMFSMTIKERGWKMALMMATIIFPFAFLVGFTVNVCARFVGVVL